MKKQFFTTLLSALFLGTVAGCVAEPSDFDAEGNLIEDEAEENVAEAEDALVPVEEQCLIEGCGGDTGGTGGTGSTNTNFDTSSSYLNAAARNILRTTGVTDADSIGATEWVNACRVSAYQGAGTFNSGVTNSCSWANVRPGWIIIETAYDVIENRNNRGSASVSSTNGPATISTVEFGSQFNAAISLAVSLGDVSAQTALQLEYQRLNGYSSYFNGQGNQIYATVKANGGLFKSSRIEIQARAKLLRIE